MIILRVRDSDPEVLRFLSQLGMNLNAVITVKDKQPFNGPITLKVNDESHSIGRELAGHVFVEAMGEEPK